ncbi:MAG: hypothetical protein ACYC8T_08195 [Myxococcaceae bacterium]
MNSPPRPPLSWRARRHLLVRSALLCWTLFFGAGHVAQVGAREVPGEVPLDVRLQVRWLERSLSDEDARFNQRVFPEGELFTWEFYGLALQNIAEQTGDKADVARATRVVRALLPKIDAALLNPPFARMAGWPLRGGICWFAGQNLLRARLVQLAPDPTAEEVARLHRDSALLYREFLSSKTGVLPAHPGLTWPVDSLFGFESLKVHDLLYGTRYFTAFGRFRGSVGRSLDPSTGLMASMLHLDGRPRDLPRGCALSWSLAVLPGLDPKLAREQWAAYKREMSSCAGGLCLFREYPAGRGRGADADSGPVVAGFGMSATAFALAAARANGDVQMATALRATGELAGLPALSWWGKRYLGGKVAMFDLLSLWVRTVPLRSAAPGPRALWPALGLALGWGGLAAVQARGLRRAARRAAPGPLSGSKRERALFAASLAVGGLHLVLAAVPFIAPLAGWAALELISRPRAGGVVSPPPS